MNGEKVYLLGMGCISNIGLDLESTRKGLFGTVAPPHLPGEWIGTSLKLPLFELDSFQTRTLSRTLGLLERAFDDALRNANLSCSDLTPFRVGTCVGTTVACQLNDLEFHRKYRSGEERSDEPLLRYFTGNPAEYLRKKHGWNGSAMTISNACASGADAVALASFWIRSGTCDIAVACGADELNRVPIAGFHALGVASDEPCRPFDAERKGLNLGEGAGVVLLAGESFLRKIPLKKNRCFLAGSGAAGDAFHITSPHTDGLGLEKAIRKALLSARIDSSELAFINAHGTGTINNDICETKVFQRMFGTSLPFLSTKGKTGHTLGAAGTLELIFTALMLQEHRIPASFGFRTKGADIAIPPVERETVIDGRFAMSTSLAFGGCNTALIVGREENS